MNSAAPRQRLSDPWLAALVGALGRIRAGSLRVMLPDGSLRTFRGPKAGPAAAVEIRDAAVARRILWGGSIAFAEGYMNGAWETPDLDALLALGLANSGGVRALDVLAPVRPLRQLWKAMRDNTVGGARRNIEYHYDLGNDFYELWLDDTMTYSAACFDAEVTELERAQRHKWDRVLELIQPRSGERLLEIGCGWGGFAIHAAEEAGCRVTGLTLSQEQAAHARRRVEERGLEGRVEIKMQDYRHEHETYGGIASIEMFEAVGEKWWPVFFGRVKELLEPRGAAGLQVITIADERFESYRRTPDFTQRYIFPGGMLPSPERFGREARAAGLSVAEPRFFGTDYARTLAEWARRFEAVVPQVHALGFDERFVRMWRYYLAYTRAGFESGNIDVMHVRLES